MGYLTFDSYRNSVDYYCSDDGYCKYQRDVQKCMSQCGQYFQKLQVVGLVCFSLLLCCVFLQIVDIIRILKYVQHISDEQVTICCIKGIMLHPIILVFGSGSILLFFLCVLFSNTFKIFDNGTFGLCYWMGFGSMILFFLIIVYYRITKNQLKLLENMANLINFNDIGVSQIKDSKAIDINCASNSQESAANLTELSPQPSQHIKPNRGAF